MIRDIFCPDCHRKAESKGGPFRYLLEDILESYCITYEPVFIINDMGSGYILEYMEKSGFILTTEIPDPNNTDRDVVLVVPKGFFRDKNDNFFFCFGPEKHA